VPLGEAAARDFERWPVEEVTSFFVIPSDPTWEGQVEVMRQFMLARAAWMDTAVDQPVDIADYPLMGD
jgi:hypothetical protein